VVRTTLRVGIHGSLEDRDLRPGETRGRPGKRLPEGVVHLSELCQPET
jgi:hypothetical protein